MRKIKEYATVGDWYEDIRKSEYTAPLIMCYTLERFMKSRKLTFPEAFNFALKKKAIFLAGNTWVINIGSSIWPDEKDWKK